MTTTNTTNFALPIPPLGVTGTADGYDTLMQTADTNIKAYLPYYVVGAGGANYANLATAVTTINTTDCTLILPVGAHVPPPTIPANIQLQFVKGAYLDTTGFLGITDIGGLAAYGATDITVTVTSHGLATNDRVCFYGITQAEWSLINNMPFVITYVDPDTFRLNSGINASGYAAYNAGADPGKIFQFTMLSCSIVDTMSKIFNVDSPAISFAGAVDGARDVYGSKVVRFRPEWWGAIADVNLNTHAGTDNIVPFRYCLQSAGLIGWLRHYAQIELTGLYYLSDTWGFSKAATNIPGESYISIEVKGCRREGCGIVSGAAGYPALEFGAWHNTSLNDLLIYGINNTGYPTVAIWLSRTGTLAAGTSELNHMEMNHIKIDGTFQYGGIFNANCEIVNYGSINSLATFTENYAFVYAGVGGPTALGFFPSIVPKFVSYDPTGTTDTCSFNTIKRLIATMPGATPPDYSSLVFLGGGATLSMEDFYYGSQQATSNCFNIKDGGSLLLRGDGSVEGVAHAAFYNLERSAGTPTVIIQEELSVNPGNLTGGYYLTSTNANVKVQNSKLISGNAAVKVAGQILNTTLYLDSGKLELDDVVGNCNITVGKNVPEVAIAGLYLVEYFYNNHLNDLRTYPTFRDASRSFSETLVSVGNRQTKGSSDNGFYAQLDIGVRIDAGPNIPTLGTWVQGSMRFNTGAAAGGSPGWVCTTAGSFGTLSGITGTIAAGTLNKITVNDLTGLYPGLYIAIVGVTGTKIIKEINSSTKVVTLTANGSEVTDAAVSIAGAPVFKAMANVGA